MIESCGEASAGPAARGKSARRERSNKRNQRCINCLLNNVASNEDACYHTAGCVMVLAGEVWAPPRLRAFRHSETTLPPATRCSSLLTPKMRIQRYRG
jgi:hypothetical protein